MAIFIATSTTTPYIQPPIPIPKSIIATCDFMSPVEAGVDIVERGEGAQARGKNIMHFS